MGRNYLETGYYTETFFPDNNVRFIAVNDNYDTNQENDFAPFKNIINEWYAKDISKKIRFSLQNKMKEPKLLGGGISLYGYIINEKKQRVIDPITAPTVRFIFESYIKGLTPFMIKQKLIENKILTPGFYAYQKNNTRSNIYYKYINTEEKYNWNSDVVARMIRNIEYTGDLINHKSKTKSYKNKKRIKVEESERYHFSDLFEPIVSKEIYYKANKLMDNLSHGSISINEKKFVGLCICVNCGTILKYERRTEGSPFYFCKNKKCNNKKHINSKKLEEVVFEDLNNLKSYIDKVTPDVLNFIKNEFKEEIKEDNNQQIIDKINHDLKQLNSKIAKLVESNLNDEIPYEVYDKLLKKYKIEKEQIEKQLKLYIKETTKKHVPIDYVELFNLFKKGLTEINKINDLTNEFLNVIINKIIIDKKDNIQKIKIDYKMNIKTIHKEYELCKQIYQQSTLECQEKMDTKHLNQ